MSFTTFPSRYCIYEMDKKMVRTSLIGVWNRIAQVVSFWAGLVYFRLVLINAIRFGSISDLKLAKFQNKYFDCFRPLLTTSASLAPKCNNFVRSDYLRRGWVAILPYQPAWFNLTRIRSILTAFDHYRSLLIIIDWIRPLLINFNGFQSVSTE